MILNFCSVDWLAAANFSSAIATVVAAIVAVQSIGAWRSEHKSKEEFDSALRLLALLIQIRSRLWLEPIAYRGDQRVKPHDFIESCPEIFVEDVRTRARENWSQIDSLILDLELGGLSVRALLGKEIGEQIRLVVSSLRAVNPHYKTLYKPTIQEMDGEDISEEEFHERVVNDAILRLPKALEQLETALTPHLLFKRK